MLDATLVQAEGVEHCAAPLLASVPEGAARLFVANKVDLLPDQVAFDGVLPISALTGFGVDALRQQLGALLGLGMNTDHVHSARARHLEAIDRAAQEMQLAESAIDGGAAAELIAESLRMAQDHLGSIVGVTTADDLLGKIFSEFCIGK